MNGSLYLMLIVALRSASAILNYAAAFCAWLQRLRAGFLKSVQILTMAIVVASVWTGNVEAANTGCDNSGNCLDLSEDGISFTTSGDPLIVNVGDGVPGDTVVNSGVIGIELTRTGASSTDIEVEFSILEKYDIGGGTEADVVSEDGINPLLVDYDEEVDLFIISDGKAEPTFTIGTDTFSSVELALYLAPKEAEFSILEKYDIGGGTEADVLSEDGINPLLVDYDEEVDLFIISDGKAEPTFTIGTDTFSREELLEYLKVNDETGATITGSLTVNNNITDGAGAPFSTTDAEGFVVISKGGTGGKGDCFTILFWSWCDDGHRGGDAGSVVVNSNSSIIVNGGLEEKHGVKAISQGGQGGGGGGWFGLFGSTAGGGGDGGDGNDVFVLLGLDSYIETNGDISHGVLAQSRGGDGGSGGDVDVLIALGSDGGNGGDAGEVIVQNAGEILTKGLNSHGIYANSRGAGAGSGSDAGGFYAEGGNGGGESAGGTVTVSNTGKVTTQSDDSFGILAQSIGGGGGDGGGAGGWFTVGGRGGSGGDGGTVSVDDTGAVETSGDRSTAIFAQSVGGGGGNGGDAVSIGQAVTVAVGGDGGLGGDGDNVAVTTGKSGGSDIDTSGGESHGIHAQSIGGGGGNGGLAITGTTPSTSPINLAISIGGNGKNGGDAGDIVSVDTASDTTIDTAGDKSHGIVAQSIGGGGGSGGAALSGSGGSGLSVSLSIGGTGALAGNGKAVVIDNLATITTSGDLSAGIFTQSIGGGGGDGGFAGSLAAGGVSASASLGGDGGLGGIGGVIDIDNLGTITTGGNGAAGIFAQSIGGGGGNGGSSFAGSIGVASASVTVGGTGGAGNTGGLVDILNAGRISTVGHNSAGIFAQSIGGGGGNGGDATSLALAGPVAVAVAVGGDGGNGGTGGDVVVTNDTTGVIHTEGVTSDGVFAQSIGGSGGSGGSATTGTLVFPIEIEGVEIPAISANVSVGGRGAGGGEAGTVTVKNEGAIVTSGFLSSGVFAQSVGGSGGRGGHATNISLAFDATFTGKVAVGGSGGQGGTGKTVTVDNYGRIHTQSDFSNGVFAQSVGGGGGTGGNATNISLSLTPPPTAPEDFIPTPSVDFDLAIGGNGGHGAVGGDVDVLNSGSVTTEGNFAAGVMAQSIGGAGGTGGDARTIQVELTADPLDFLPLTDLASLDLTLVFGGTGGDGSHGGEVTVDNISDPESTGIHTGGAFSHGIVAQSVGGGGGSGGSAMTFEFSNADVIPDIPVLDDISDLTTLEMTLQGSGGAGGDGGDVTLKSTGNILTEGDFAFGAVAQSVAGGGGLAGFFNPHGIINNEIGDAVFNTLVDTDAGLSFAGSVGGAGTAGDVNIYHAGNIQTLGDGAHGLFAQSAAGQGGAGSVDVALNGEIRVLGDYSSGIYAQSGGGSGNSDITLTIEDGGIVSGGTGSGAGVAISGGMDNALSNYGTITSLPGAYGRAIVATSGNEFVENNGTVIGSVYLDKGDNAFNNQEGALFNSGETVVLGSGNTLTNAGTLSPGAEATTFNTDLDGDLVQSSTGVYAVDLDLLSELTDRVTATGSANLGGQASVNPVNAGYAKPGNPKHTILSGAGGVTGSGLALDTLPSAVIKYELLYPNATDVVLGSAIDFSPQGLNSNQAAIGDHVNEIQLAGGSDSFAPVAEGLFFLPDLESLAMAYNQLSPQVYLDTAIASLFSNMQLKNDMLSCRERSGDYRFVSEGECRWMRLAMRRLNFDFDEWAVSLSGGMQKAIGERLHAGFALSYERSSLDDGSGAVSDGDKFQAGAVLKVREGATTFSAAVSGGYGWHDTQRDIDFPPTLVRAVGKQEIGFISLHARLAHLLEWEDWYLRPQIDVGVTHVSFEGFRERGAGGANLDVKGHDETYVSLQPALEVGGEIKRSDGTLVRPYAKLGITHFLSGTTPEITAVFQGTPAGVAPFSIKSDVDENFVELSLGLDVLKQDGINFRFNYTGQFSGNMENHGVGFKVTIPF